MVRRQERSGEAHQPEIGPQILYMDSHKSHNCPSRNGERDPFLRRRDPRRDMNSSILVVHILPPVSIYIFHGYCGGVGGREKEGAAING